MAQICKITIINILITSEAKVDNIHEQAENSSREIENSKKKKKHAYGWK